MIECNSGSFEVLGAIDNLSFGKLFKCIHTSLSSAGNQVWVNHLTQLQQPMSDPTNESSHEPIFDQPNDWDRMHCFLATFHQKEYCFECQ
jgi:hypothetical protein